jgi:hypothetical protein
MSDKLNIAEAQAEQTRKLQEDFEAKQAELAEEVTKAYEEDRTDAVGAPVEKKTEVRATAKK